MVSTVIQLMLCTILGLIRIPNVYIIPIYTPVFLTNNIARMLVICALFFILVFNNKEATSRIKKVNYLLFAFLITQTFSVIYAQNLTSFLTAYKDILFGTCIYLVFYLGTDKRKINQLLYMLFVICLFNIGWELSLYLLPNAVTSWAKVFFNYNYFQAFMYEFNRGRYYADMLDEAFVPLAIYLFFLKNKGGYKNRILTMIYLILVSYIVIMSNWRTKFIIFLFSSASALLTFWKRFRRIIGYVVIVFFTVLFSLYFSYSSTSNRNIFDRVLSPDDGFFAETDVSRINYWKDAQLIGLSHPIFGVGLGNYYDNLSQRAKNQNKSSSTQGKQRILIDDPHDIFMSIYASSGALGLSSFVLLLCSLLFFDIKQLTRKTDERSMVLISIFWSIFIYSLFNPWLYFAYLSPLLAMRGIVDANNTNV